MTTETANWVGIGLAGGRYLVSAKLGEGGMGFVYRARDRNLDTDVVIKVPRPSMLEDAEFAHRFAREIRSLVRLAHPHIVKVTDVGEHEGIPFAVMDYLSGGSLRNRQESDAEGNRLPMPEEKLRDWLPGVAEALDYIHRQGYIHRDVKPDNILFDAHGHVYLSDFGVAKVLAERSEGRSKTMHTAAGMILGTPQYMAPELIMGEHADARVDQYALAVMLYELLSGRYPFDGPTAPSIFVMHTTQEPEPLEKILTGASPGVAQAVYRGLAKDPKQRFADCGSFARAVLQGLGAPTNRPAGAAPASTAPADRPRPTTVKCPACHKCFALPAGAAGKRLRCTACGERFQAPAEPASRPSTVRETVAEVGRTQPVKVESERARPGTQAWSPTPPPIKPSQEAIPPPSTQPISRRELRPMLLILPAGLLILLVATAIGVFLLSGDSSSDKPQPEVAHAKPSKSPPTPAEPARDDAAQRETTTSAQVPAGTPSSKPPTKKDKKSKKGVEQPPPIPPSGKAVPSTLPARLLPVEAITLVPGQNTSVQVRIERNGLEGPVPLEVNGLPAGVTARPAVIGAFQSDGAVELMAAADAGASNKTAQVRATLGETSAESSLRITVRRLSSLVLAPLADVTIEPGDKQVLDIQVERKDCAGPITVQVSGLPAKVAAARATIPADQNIGHVELTAALDAENGDRPARVVARLGNVEATGQVQVTVRAPETFSFGKHMYAVNSVAFSPDGKFVASGSDDETVGIWDLKNGKEVWRFKGHATGAIRSVAFTPDGSQILCAGDSWRMRLCSIGTKTELDRFGAHSDRIDSAVLSKDGQYALSGSEDKTIRLWDVATGQELRRLTGHADPVGCVALSPDRRMILSANRLGPTTKGGDCRVWVWEMLATKPSRYLEGHTRPVQSIVFSPDGKRVLTGSLDQTIRLWDVATGQELRQFKGHAAGVTSVVFSPDGRRALSGSTDQSVRLWDVESGKEVRQFRGHQRPVTCVAFAPDGHRAVSGSADRTLRLWQLPK